MELFVHVDDYGAIMVMIIDHLDDYGAILHRDNLFCFARHIVQRW